MTGLTIATWNINSVRLRIDHVTRYLAEWRPDVLCLQETKTEDPTFPGDALAAAGYPYQAIRGMKSYNGVAIVSRLPIDVFGGEDWCGKRDARHVSAVINGIEIHNLYIPAGGDVPDPAENEKFAHKLQFIRDITDWFATARAADSPMVLVGDLNVAPLEHDVWSHKALLDVVSHTPIEVDLLDRLRTSANWVDAVRHFVPADQKLYSWWSYRARDWEESDRGRRLDHVWVTPPLVGRLKRAEIAKPVRGWVKSSDHVPVLVELGAA